MAVLLSIVIPCLNEEQTIGRVLEDALHYAKKYFPQKYEVIVSDNGSTDASLKIIKKYPVRLIKVPVRGYGAALHWGIMNSRGQYVLFADADLSYPFLNLPGFKKLIFEHPDLVTGSRLAGKIEPGSMPWMHQHVGTPFLTFLIRSIYHLQISDCTSGMQMIRRDFYPQLNMRNAGMEWGSELIIKTALNKGRHIELPIEFKKDQRNRAPHLSRWSDGWRYLKAIVLIKPSSLYPFIVIFPLLASVLYPLNFSLSFLFFSLTYILILSLLALHLMGSVIEKRHTPLSRFLIHFKLVPITIFGISIIIILAILLPKDRLGMKLFLVNLIGISCMWIFLIETIKTHLVNRLPENIQ